MVIDRDQKYREMAARGQYQGLYTHLRGHQTQEWSTSLGEIESITGFELPPSARLHRPWWANQSSGSDHRVLIDLLGLPTSVLESLDLLRLKWCSEPSVHGGKKTAPGDR